MDLYFKIKVYFRFDEQSSCWIYYNRKYNIYGYGKTTKEADKSFRFTLNEILKHKK